MEIRVVDSAETREGAIRPRTMCKIPTALFMSGLALVGIVILVWGAWWMLLPALLVYAWCRWQTQKDPYWIQTWWNHLKHKPVYEG